MKQSLVDYWLRSGIVKDNALIKAFEKIPRENFIPKHLKEEAYEDIPLPIGEAQTISQPTTIMIMTQALEVKKGDMVLEIGSGSGYQSALLAELVGKKGFVYTVEIIPKLAEFAEKNLRKCGTKNVKVICGDGSKGYKKSAPYDKCIVTAGAPETPKPLLEQLKNNGILVAPIGPLYSQRMLKIRKIKNRLEIENLGDFVFVPLKGTYGWREG